MVRPRKKKARKPTKPKKTTAPKPKKKRRKRRSKVQIDAAKVRRKLREDRAPGRGITADDRKRVYAFYGRRCMVCGTTKRLVLDHVKALYCGGRHDPDNLQPLCYKCNTKKGLQTRDYRPMPFYY